jgi:hypothetical protein
MGVRSLVDRAIWEFLGRGLTLGGGLGQRTTGTI